jgi:hypothetical protein
MLGAPGMVFNNSGTTTAVGGTSIATPQLAGLAACLWQFDTKATPYTLRKAIKESAHLAASPNNNLGFGVPDFAKAFSSLLVISPCNCLTNNVYLFPNPAIDKITVQILGSKSQATIKWAIIDLMGRTVFSGSGFDSNNKVVLDVVLPTSLNKGIYLFVIQTSEYNRTFKIEKG